MEVVIAGTQFPFHQVTRTMAPEHESLLRELESNSNSQCSVLKKIVLRRRGEVGMRSLVVAPEAPRQYYDQESLITSICLYTYRRRRGSATDGQRKLTRIPVVGPQPDSVLRLA